MGSDKSQGFTAFYLHTALGSGVYFRQYTLQVTFRA
jgi:hypothetical protein